MCLHVWRRRQLSLKNSHEEVKLTEGTAVTATQSRLVLYDIADILQLLVTQFALMKPAKEEDGQGMNSWKALIEVPVDL